MNNLQTNKQLQHIESQLQILNINPHQGDSKRHMRYQLRLAKQKLQQQRKEAHLLRQTHLTFRQEILVLEERKYRAKAVATIQRAERRARCFRKFHVHTKPPRSTNGLAYVIQTNAEGEHTRIQQPNELQEVLYHRNRIHFDQANGTPFTRPPLSTLLIFNGVSEFGDRILNGDQLTCQLSASATAILSELRRVRPPLSHQMTLEEMIGGISKWRESTTTSPSNNHLGIYKSLVQHYKHTITQTKTAKQTTTPTHPNTALAALQIQLHLTNLAIVHTHTFDRWKSVHNYFLEKIPGNPLIDKLRVKHIYEADWNLLLKIFTSYKLTHTACQQKTETAEQAGGRIGRSASDMATTTVLTHEICRLQKLAGAIVINDAKACFDRIIENLSNLACLREGLAPELAKLHAQTGREMRYYIKT
jgi:hypothetical protein